MGSRRMRLIEKNEYLLKIDLAFGFDRYKPKQKVNSGYRIVCPNRLWLYQPNAEPKTFRCTDESNPFMVEFLTLALGSRLVKTIITTCVSF